MTFTPIGQTAQMHLAASPKEGGVRRGATGSEIKRRDTSEIAAWLAGKAPTDMDKAAASRASSHGVVLRVRYEGRYPSGPNGERLPSYDVAVGCEISRSGDREAALEDLRNFIMPAPVRQIEEWLAELSVMTAGRGREGFDAELMLNAYSSRLGKYPADVVRYALLVKTWKWFPTWDEVEKICEAMAGPRRQMILALERGPKPPEKEWRHATPEEKARIAALVDELFPQKSPEDRAAAVDEATRGMCMFDTPKTIPDE